MKKTDRWNALLRGGMLVCILFFFTKSNAQVEVLQKGFTKITGQINDTKITTIGIKFYRDFISRDEEVFDVPIVDNKFSITFQLTQSTPAFLIYDGQEIPLFLDPEDDLYINYVNNDFGKNITFAGKGAGKSRYLQNINTLFPERNADYIFYELVERDAMDFRKYMDRLHQKMWRFYKSLTPTQKKDFSPEFEHYIKADIDYWYAYNLLRYRVENPISNGVYELMELPVAYYSFLNNILISNAQALMNRNYLYFIDQYISFRNHLFESQSEVSFLTHSVVVTAPSMLVFSKPNRPPILEQVEKNTPLKFLGKKTDFKSQIQIKDKIEESYWYQVKSTTNENGWIHGSGIRLDSCDNQLLQNRLAFPKGSKYENVYKLFCGKTLFYILANDLYWNTTNLSSEKLLQKLDNYIELNPYEQFDSILLYTLQENNPQLKSRTKIVQNIDILTPPSPRVELAMGPTLTQVIDNPKGGSPSVSKPVKKKKIFKNRSFQPKEPFLDIDARPADRPTTLSAISGKIKNPTGAKLILMFYSDPITLEEIVHELDLKANGTFELSLNLAQPAIGVLKYGKQRADIYLEPGDLVQVRFSGNDFLETLQFAGKGAAHNNYLKDKKIKFQQSDKKTRKEAEKLKEAAYKKWVEKNKKEKNNFLNHSRYLSKFSDKFKKYATAEVEYWAAFMLLNYRWEYPLSNNMDAPMDLSKEYLTFLDSISVSQNGALPNLNYTYFLDQFFEYETDQPENKDLNMNQLIDKYLTDEPAAYFKAKKLAIACKRGKARKEAKNIAAFIENNPYEIYNDVLRLVYNEAKGLQVGRDAPDFTLTDVNGKEVMLSEFKGKVVYLDFWATWCSPCLHQMKNSKIWKSSFKNKDVVFIYVSLDKNRTSWEKFIKNNNPQGIHLIASGGDVYKSQIAKLYKVKKLPAYFLIDKQGKIAFKPERGKNITRVQDKIQMLLGVGR